MIWVLILAVIVVITVVLFNFLFVIVVVGIINFFWLLMRLSFACGSHFIYCDYNPVQVSYFDRYVAYCLVVAPILVVIVVNTGVRVPILVAIVVIVGVKVLIWFVIVVNIGVKFLFYCFYYNGHN